MTTTGPLSIFIQPQTNETETISHLHACAGCVFAGLVVVDNIAAARTGSELRSHHCDIISALIPDLKLPGKPSSLHQIVFLSTIITGTLSIRIGFPLLQAVEANIFFITPRTTNSSSGKPSYTNDFLAPWTYLSVFIDPDLVQPVIIILNLLATEATD